MVLPLLFLMWIVQRTKEERERQTRRDVEFEEEDEYCNSSPEGHQYLHQGVLRLQNQASLKDGEGTHLYRHPCLDEVRIDRFMFCE